MHLVIDGYNLIGSRSGLEGKLEEKRRQLIKRLSVYRRKRGHAITVVFDGWGSDWEFEQVEVIEGVEVIFSRRRERADGLICRIARRLGASCVVVTSDRAVQAEVKAAGATAVFSTEFERRLWRSSTGESRSADVAGERPEEESQGRVRNSRKKGNPSRRSKAERRRMVKLRKL